jgi:LemA protein
MEDDMFRFYSSLISIVIMLSVAFTGCGYNKMQQLEEEVLSAWGDIEANLQRRMDLIPNLVEVVKGYAKHEKDTLTAVIEARAKATQTQINVKDLGNPEALQKFQQAQDGLTSALSRLMIVVERYPELKANQNFTDLQNQLEGTENRINVARQRYNAAVKEFNFSIRKFPYNITNNIFLNLEKKEYFKAKEGSDKAPEVKF